MVAEDKYKIYVDLLKEVGSYCMQMGVLLFKSPVDPNSIEDHIDKTTFKAQLPPAVEFPCGPDKQTIILNDINTPVECHRNAQ